MAQAILVIDHVNPVPLTRRQRETLGAVAAIKEDETVVEIAQRRGVGAGAIYSTLERARRRAEGTVAATEMAGKDVG